MNKDSVRTTKYTYNKISTDYALRNRDLKENVKELLDLFIKLLVDKKKVLDVGCAHGRESKYLSEKGCEVTGLDISEELIDIAKRNCRDCKFVIQDMRRVKFGANSFNGIWVNSSFLHIPKKDAQKTIRTFHDILTSHGIMFINVMKGDYDGFRINKDMNWPERHFSDYSKSEFQEMLQNEGFLVTKLIEFKVSWGVEFLNFFVEKDS